MLCSAARVRYLFRSGRIAHGVSMTLKPYMTSLGDLPVVDLSLLNAACSAGNSVGHREPSVLESRKRSAISTVWFVLSDWPSV